ncbi:DUF1217 domain-containing protein [Roseomonas sp. SSH11]|uniref:DUF1217 domain-containing protein n=1 Tax=Pararoseomonas baculiformis TaxID=2820812 RepID=A0ABS4AKW1_9PROT|nr:DUF1217 domain-containing protein [Pararoseomonas baculiformis]MBP0447663.1 DUF1217 domain-containing protein [Pararoseomonas baculiformis]
MAANPNLLTLFGGSAATPTSMSSSEAVTFYNQSLKNAGKDTERLRADPTIKRELASLFKAVDKARAPEDLLRDPDARRVLMQGLGLADQVDNAGLAIKALTSDPSKPNSLAKQLPDQRWSSAAAQLDFAASGLKKLKDPAFRQLISDGLVEYRRLSAISKKSQIVADALAIKALPDTKPNIYTVLGDKVMRRVATTVASLPDQLALQSIEAQARSLSARFDVDQFADPKKRDKLIQRYLVAASGSGISLMA